MKKLVLTLPGLMLPGGYGIEYPQGFEFADATIGDVFSKLLPYVFVLAGLLLFGLLIMAGFGFLTSAGDPKKVESAKGKLTNAVIGFVIIFVAYWLMQILEVIFNLKIF